MTDDKKIISAIKKGDNGLALKLLYESALRKVRAYITKNSGSIDDANDIFQDAVIVFIRQVRYGKFDDSLSVDGFVYTVARNLWINKVLKDKKKLQVHEEGVLLDMQEEFQMNDDMKERETVVISILQRLGEKCYEILRQMIFEGLDYKEIAHNTGLASSDVVKTYKNRCKKKLVDLLNENSALRNQLLKYEKGFRSYIKFA